MLYFLHIPKTAGSTLNYIIKNNYGEKAKEIRWHWTTWITPDALREKLKSAGLENRELIHGHFVFGVHALVSQSQAKYVTFVRDPLKKAISGFYHVWRDEKSEYHSVYKTGDIDQYLLDKNIVENNNSLVRRLAGIGNDVAYGNVERKHLDQAIQNINNHFLAVGITEKFDLSIELFRHIGIFERVYYWKQNMARNKNNDRRVPSRETMTKFKELNSYDFELYDYCVDQFRKKTDNLNFSQSAFTLRNNLYNVFLLPRKVLKRASRIFKF